MKTSAMPCPFIQEVKSKGLYSFAMLRNKNASMVCFFSPVFFTYLQPF